MTDHQIQFTYDSDYVNAELLCTAPPEAACHWAPDCDCETYGALEKDVLGWFHMALEYNVHEDGDEVESVHRHHQTSGCNYRDWINADSPLECGPEGKIDLVALPVNLVWQGDFYQWVPEEQK